MFLKNIQGDLLKNKYYFPSHHPQAQRKKKKSISCKEQLRNSSLFSFPFSLTSEPWFLSAAGLIRARAAGHLAATSLQKPADPSLLPQHCTSRQDQPGDLGSRGSFPNDFPALGLPAAHTHMPLL